MNCWKITNKTVAVQKKSKQIRGNDSITKNKGCSSRPNPVLFTFPILSPRQSNLFGLRNILGCRKWFSHSIRTVSTGNIHFRAPITGEPSEWRYSNIRKFLTLRTAKYSSGIDFVMRVGRGHFNHSRAANTSTSGRDRSLLTRSDVSSWLDGNR